jgi:hypothetical protein
MTVYNAIKLLLYMLEMLIILILTPVFGLGHVIYLAFKERAASIKSKCDKMKCEIEAE